MTKFKKAGIQPFGVNPAGVGSHQSYVEKLGFNFPLLSDPERAMARAYAVLKDDERGIQRTVGRSSSSPTSTPSGSPTA